MKDQAIPYKIYLQEEELPKAWYNLRADMKNKPAPLLNPATLKPMTADELRPVFCDELVAQELDDTTPYIEIPQEIRDFYKMYRPSPLVRAYCLEEKLQTPAKIYYKFEGNNTSGSHKLNSAIAQAYYAKKQGLKGVTTETGAGQWGTALSMACSYFGLDCKVYMVKVSYEQKPFRREVMRTYGANVTPSPSDTTQVGRKILEAHPGTGGSLGCAISEAVEAATTQPGYRYVLGSVLSQVVLHQSVIGLEAKAAMDKYGVKPDIIIGCAGGGSNLGGLIAPFMGQKLRGEADYRIIAIEPASCPSFTRGKFAYDFCDFFVIELPDDLSTDAVDSLLEARIAEPVYRPIVLKIPKELTENQLENLVDYCLQGNIDGIETRDITQLRHIREYSKGLLPIIANNHIDTPERAAEALRAGASLVEVRTGLVHEGPGIVRKILKLLQETEKQPASGSSDAADGATDA